VTRGFCKGVRDASTTVVLRTSCAQINENKKDVPPRVEYVLEAQARKEARDDPRRRKSSPEILLHDGAGGKRQDFTGGCGRTRNVLFARQPATHLALVNLFIAPAVPTLSFRPKSGAERRRVEEPALRLWVAQRFSAAIKLLPYFLSFRVGLKARRGTCCLHPAPPVPPRPKIRRRLMPPTHPISIVIPSNARNLGFAGSTTTLFCFGAGHSRCHKRSASRGSLPSDNSPLPLPLPLGLLESSRQREIPVVG
jgi:hypothetical protein